MYITIRSPACCVFPHLLRTQHTTKLLNQGSNTQHAILAAAQYIYVPLHMGVSEWLDLITFLGTSDIEVNIVHKSFAAFCFIVVMTRVSNGFIWSIYLYLLGLLHWHWGSQKIAPVPVKQLWSIWVKLTSTIPLQNTTKHKQPCIYFFGCTAYHPYIDYYHCQKSCMLCFLPSAEYTTHDNSISHGSNT